MRNINGVLNTLRGVNREGTEKCPNVKTYNKTYGDKFLCGGLVIGLVIALVGQGIDFLCGNNENNQSRDRNDRRDNRRNR